VATACWRPSSSSKIATTAASSIPRVFGGSWGSTLALAYTITHPERVEALVLRGIFTLTEREVRWFYQDGASFLFPDAWARYLAPIPPEERGDLLHAYHRRLTGADEAAKAEAATAWSQWEGDTISIPDRVPLLRQQGFLRHRWLAAGAGREVRRPARRDRARPL